MFEYAHLPVVFSVTFLNGILSVDVWQEKEHTHTHKSIVRSLRGIATGERARSFFSLFSFFVFLPSRDIFFFNRHYDRIYQLRRRLKNTTRW